MTSTKNEKTEVMNFSGLLTKISAVLFFMFILLKPYYLKPSGSIGAADICLAAAGAVMIAAELMRIMSIICGLDDENAASYNESICGTLFGNTENALIRNKVISGTAPYSKDVSGKSGLLEILNVCVKKLFYSRDIALYAFMVLAAVVNSIYSFRLGSQEYTKYTIYWLYNCLAVWTLRKLRDADRGRNDAGNRDASPAGDDRRKGSGEFSGTCGYTSALKKGKISSVLQRIRRLSFDDVLCIMLEINIVIQFIIMLSGHGRYFVEYWGAVRYMGSFNDPNQLAFFMFISMLLIYSLTSGETGKKLLQGYVRIAVYVSAIIIIIRTKSTGIMLGVAAFAFLSWCRWIWEAVQNGRVSRKLITAVVIICAVCAAGLLICIWPSADFDVKNVEYNTLTRIQEKLWKLSRGGMSGFLIDRGGGKLAAFPQYMLFGAGEGGFDRFAIAGQEINEIHCGPMSILFCYGIIPALFMIKWLVDSLKHKNSRQLCACLALIVESMTLINYRQPMFWFLLM